jgi:hypothetical protein
MKRITGLLLLAGLLATSASAEIRSINITIFGMD